MTADTSLIIAIVFLILFLIPCIFFLIEQQNILKDIRPENRLMRPGQVWLQLIPIFNIVYQFIVVTRIADSIQKELTSPSSVSWLESEQVVGRPTFGRGMAMCILMCCGIVPLGILKSLLSLATLIMWILYWVQLRQYHTKVRHQLGMA